MQGVTLDILAKMTTELLEATSIDAGLRALTDAALRVTPANHASVRLCGDDNRLSVGARSGAGLNLTPRAFATGEGVMGWVAATGRVARIGDSRLDPRFRADADAGFPIASVMSVPIIAAGRTLGVLSMSAGQRDAFDASHEAVATLLANTAASALRNAELARMAITDAHTQAYNRGHLLPRLTEEMERAQRHGESISLLLMDLDHFKRVNDRHGHGAGDEVLRRFADRVRAVVRSIDVLIRRGGEEFVLILPSTDQVAAMQVAERVRTGLNSAPLRLTSGVSLHQTVSIGVAVWDGQESAEALDERADLAMYDAKRSGRDRVVLAGLVDGRRKRQTGPTRRLQHGLGHGLGHPPLPSPVGGARQRYVGPR